MDITGILDDWGRGDRTALDRLAPVVYPQLQSLAASYLRNERYSPVLQPTVLVNELFLKLMTRRQAKFESRQHFFALAAKLMRLALIDHARNARAGKRGGNAAFVPLHDEIRWVDAAGPAMLDLDRALEELEAIDPQKARLFELRFILNCTADEAAELAGVSKATVDRQIRLARAWLYMRLREGSASASAPDQV